MNVFYTNENPSICAMEHCLKHQTKMIVEYAQLLSTAHHELDGECAIQGIYKSTHKHHPSSIWVRESSDHYQYVYDLLENLCNLYTERKGKVHKTSEKLGILCNQPANIERKGFVEPPKAMPDEFKSLDTIEAYKAYLNDKWLEWITRVKPLAVKFQHSAPSWVSQDITGECL